MPAFNAQMFIEEAIQSVLDQTHEDFELIVINDGSSDSTQAIVSGFTDPRIRVHTMANAGCATAMNIGVALARTEWIAVMHADDVMFPNRLERQLAFVAEHPEISFASSLVRHIDAIGRVIGKDNSKLTTHAAVDAMIATNEPIGFNHPAVVFRKAAVLAVGGYRQQFWPSEDIDLWNRLVERGYRVLVQPEFLMGYRIHGQSASIASARLIRFKIRWIKESMMRRRSGQPEASEAGFAACERSMGPINVLNRERKDTSRIFYKSAVFSFARRKYVKAGAYSLLAVGLRPVLMVREIGSKLDLRSRLNSHSA